MPRNQVNISVRDPEQEHHRNHLRQMIARLLLGAAIGSILFCGLFPFDFAFRPSTAAHEIHERFDTTLNQLRSAGDGPENVVFFLPFGFALGAMCWNGSVRQHGWRTARRLLLAGLLSAALSAFIELSQVFLVSRDPSLADVTSNTFGGLLGFCLFIAAGELVMRQFIWLATAIRRAADARLFGLATVIWALVILFLPVAFREIGSLRGWHPGYPLLIGNDTSNESGWKGRIANLTLGDRELSSHELQRVLTGSDPITVLGDHALAGYLFRGPGPYSDVLGKAAGLRWATDHPADATQGPSSRGEIQDAAPITWAWWLSSDGDGLARASLRIAQTSAFTIVADLAVADLRLNDRYPRIVSLAGGASDCDVQLIQDQDALLVRVSSEGSGNAGTDPEFVAPGVFTDRAIHRLVVTYDNGHLVVACNARRQIDSVRVTPEAWLIWRIYPRSTWRFRMDSPGQSFCGMMYRTLAMGVFGLLLGATIRAIKRPLFLQRYQIALAVVSIGLMLALLESILHLLSGAPLHLPSSSAGFIAAVAGFLMICRCDFYLFSKRKLVVGSST